MNRKYRHLSREERYEIKRMYDLGVSINKIAQHLTRSKSTISMELKRQNLRYVIANMLKTLTTKLCFYSASLYNIVIAKIKGTSKLHEKGTREVGVT